MIFLILISRDELLIKQIYHVERLLVSVLFNLPGTLHRFRRMAAMSKHPTKQIS